MIFGKIQYGNLLYLLHLRPGGIEYELVYEAEVPAASGYFLRQQYLFQNGVLRKDPNLGLVFDLREEREVSEDGFRQFQQLLANTPLVEPETCSAYLQNMLSGDQDAS